MGRAGKIRFSGTQKSMLLKASSGECCAPRNFGLLMMLGGTCVYLIMYLIVYQMKVDYGKINFETNSSTALSITTTSLTWRH